MSGLVVRGEGAVRVVGFQDGNLTSFDPDTRRRLEELVPTSKFVVVDLSAFDALSWDDLGSLMAIKKAHRARWGTHMNHFKVVVRPGRIRDMIKDLRMEHILTTYRSREDAMATFPTRRVLHVESEDGAAGLVEIVLETNGFEVLRARSPEEIPSRDEVGRLDLILTAIDFGSGDDFDLVRRLRVSFGAPVGVLASRPVKSVEGAAFVIQKPVSPELLIRQIGNLDETTREDHYRILFEFVPIPLCVVADGRRVLVLNRAWRDLLGLLPEETHARSLEDVLPADFTDRAACLARLTEVLTRGGELEWESSRPGGRIRVRIRAVPAVVEHELSLVLLTAQDLSGEARTRAAGDLEATVTALESEGQVDIKPVLVSLIEDLDQSRSRLSTANEKLVELDRLKSEFISTVSHELRTPLSAIKGSVENLLDGYLGEVSASHRRTLEVILRNSRRLARLIDNLLDFSKIEAGALEYTMRKLDLSAVARNACEEMQTLAVKSGVALEIDLPAGPAWVLGDSDRLVQVVVNLLDNAIRFAARRVRLRIQEREDEAVLAVEDDGPGIPESDLERVFERFSRVRQHDHKSQTGLGLSIVRGIVIAHQGRVRAENRADSDGPGSRFIVTLPLRKGPGAGPGSVS